MPGQEPSSNPYAAPAAANELSLAQASGLSGAYEGAPYRSSQGVATVTKVFLALDAVVALLSFIVEAGLASDPRKLGAGGGWALAYGGLAILFLLLLLGSAISFCIWFYRVYANLPALSGLPTAYSLGWAPGSFFVPFLNLVRPFSIAREIWRSSAQDEVADNWGIVKLWWALWLLGGIASRIGNRMSGSRESLASGLWVMSFGELLIAGAAIVAVMMVGRITARQAQHAKALGLG